MESVSEQLLKTTVRIETPISTGTGFYFNFSDDPNNNIVPFIVTNKHVLEGADSIKIVLSVKKDNDKNFESFDFNISDVQNGVTYHPDYKVDLAILSIGQVILKLNELNYESNIKYLDCRLIPDESVLKSLDPIEDVTVVGYPNGIWDHVNNSPIVRTGVTATDIKNDFQGEPKFLIDCAIFPGSSGSPVFIYNKSGYTSNEGMFLGETRLLFVGINHATFIHNSFGEIFEKSIPSSYGTVVGTPNNLGIILKSSLILDFQKNILNNIRESIDLKHS